MIFIFDWGFETVKTIGPLSKEDLKDESGAEHVWLQIITQWFRVFFIPLIPTKLSYALTDVNTSKSKFISKDQFDKLRPLAALNNQVMNDEITDEEYQRKSTEL